MSHFGYGGGYGDYGSYNGYRYYGGYSDYGMYDPIAATSDSADGSVQEIIVTAPRQSYSFTQYYVQDISYTPPEGAGGEPDKATEEKIANLISKVAGGLKAIEPYLSGKPKEAVEKIEAVLDVIEKGEMYQGLTSGDMKQMLATVIDNQLSAMTQVEFSATVAAIVGAIGAESGPVDLALASAGGAAGFYAYYKYPTGQIADSLAGALVDGVEKLAH